MIKEQIPQPLQEKLRHEIHYETDLLSKSIYNEIPSVSSEMLYRAQLDSNSRVYAILLAFGILLILTVALYV